MFLEKVVSAIPSIVAFKSPREALKELPDIAIKPMSYMPFVLQKVALSKLLIKVFAEHLAEGDMDFLQGYWLKIDVSDTGISLQFSCGPRREVWVRKHGKADACIRGTMKSFLYLAARKEDPDTLFFQRNLVVEGDTNLGLEVKNLMDSLDLEQLPPELTFGIRCCAEYIEAFC